MDRKLVRCLASVAVNMGVVLSFVAVHEGVHGVQCRWLGGEPLFGYVHSDGYDFMRLGWVNEALPSPATGCAGLGLAGKAVWQGADWPIEAPAYAVSLVWVAVFLVFVQRPVNALKHEMDWDGDGDGGLVKSAACP